MTDQPTQRSHSWLEQISSPEAIHAAVKAGELRDLLAGRDPAAEEPQHPATDWNDAQSVHEHADRLEQETARLQQQTQHGDADQGARRTVIGVSAQDIAGASPDQIVAWQRQGLLGRLLSGDDRNYHYGE